VAPPLVRQSAFFPNFSNCCAASRVLLLFELQRRKSIFLARFFSELPAKQSFGFCLELWRRNSKGNGELRQRSPCPFVLALYVGYVFLREKNIRILVVKKKGPSLVRKGNGARR